MCVEGGSCLLIPRKHQSIILQKTVYSIIDSGKSTTLLSGSMIKSSEASVIKLIRVTLNPPSVL